MSIYEYKSSCKNKNNHFKQGFRTLACLCILRYIDKQNIHITFRKSKKSIAQYPYSFSQT